MKEIGKRIETLRKLLGISKKEFAEKLKVSPAYITQIEYGKKNLQKCFYTSSPKPRSKLWMAKGRERGDMGEEGRTAWVVEGVYEGSEWERYQNCLCIDRNA